MVDSESIRRIIREQFSYLTTDYNFIDNLEIGTDEIYSEVRYEKNGWTISIVTTAHGTRISLKLISPQNDFGFLSHYFNSIDKEYNSKSKTKNLIENIKYHSDFLKNQGNDILTANSERLTKILGLIKIEHDKWVKPFIE